MEKDLERNSQEEHLLCGSSSSSAQVIYKLLLNALKPEEFHFFEKTVKRNLKKQPAILDINYAYENLSNMTCLDIASQRGLTEFVEFLLHNGAKPNRVNKICNRAPIHFATEKEHENTLAALLKEQTINPDLEAGGDTALHFAVKKKNRECAGMLLDKGASASIPNNTGTTALHLAAMAGQREMTELILKKCKQSLDLDSYKDFKGNTTRDVIEQKMPDLLLPPKQENRKPTAHHLKYYLTMNDETNFLQTWPLVEVPCSVAEDLLRTAVQNNFDKAVREILKKCEGNLSVKDAAYVAVQQSNHTVLEQLLNRKAGTETHIANQLILPVCQELGMPGKQGVDNTSDRLQCLKLILDKNADVRCTDEKGSTPLHYAARAGCCDAMDLLLKRESYIGYMNRFDIPPIADIPVSVLSRYFNDCLRMQKETTNEYTLEFNYRCLMPFDTATMEHKATHRAICEMDLFKYIADDSRLKELLKHPLLSSFLYLKWHRIKNILYANFAFYVLFYLVLNVYILNMSYGDPSKNTTQMTNDSFDTSLGSISRTAPTTNSFLWFFTATLLLIFLIRELFQFISCPWHYVKNLGNWLEVLLIVLTFALLYGAGPQIGALTILLSAWELIILISQHPRMSTSIEMFRRVSSNFVRYLFPYVFLIFAFALAFHILFKEGDDTTFHDPGRSFFKTIIMLTGEFDADDIPFISYPIWSHFIFMIFVFLIAIVLFNLLNGLAVSDTASILKEVELIKLVSRVHLLSYIEDIAIGRLFNPWFCYGNSCSLRRWNPFGFLKKTILLFPHYLKDGQISIKLHNCPDTYDNGRNYKTHPLSEATEIIKQAIEICNQKNQIPSDNERIINALNNLQKKLEAMEDTLNKTCIYNRE